ncbi:hypothetical protein [Pseudomonas savastanoi]|uniref:hypothetical protein n=1 Tax=Pseudomonas savastanoi TaxID=29438 RepID=UPI000F0067F7|nr:hypothetical protein [Pseudomonas savastanoi]
MQEVLERDGNVNHSYCKKGHGLHFSREMDFRGGLKTALSSVITELWGEKAFVYTPPPQVGEDKIANEAEASIGDLKTFILVQMRL